MKVAIFGSCVTRDAFNLEEAGRFELVSYFAKSSLASAFDPVEVPDSYSARLASAFQRRIVQADFAKSFAKALAGLEFDMLLLDAIDERFSLCAFESGGLCTVSTELASTGFNQSRPAGRLIRSGTDEFFSLWERGWAALLAALAAGGRLDRLRINKAFWSERDAEGADYAPAYPRERIAGANAFLRRLYQRMAEDLPGGQFLEFEPGLLVGAAEHRWGRCPFHYAPEYYASLLARLTAPTTEGG